MSLLKGLPVEHYGCIVADPPWAFKTWSEKNQTRSASNHYGVMTLEDIQALPVKHLAADNALLFLWVTNPMLQQGLDTIRAWGFDYSTVAFSWAKATKSSDPTWAPKWHFGMGYWTRSNVELVLLGVRGKPKRINADVRQLITAPVREHSRKPDEVYAGIERLCEGPRLELFGRQSREGWTVRGNQSTKFDVDAPQSATGGAVEAVRAPATQHPGPDATALLARLRRGAGRVGGIPRLTIDDAAE